MAMTLGENGVKSEINITPYIDILLTLLVIFMVITPVRQLGFPVKVPQPAPEKQEPASSANTIVVTVGKADHIALNQQPVGFSDLGAKLEQIYSARANKTMFISASPDLPYGDVVHVIDVAKGAGAGDIGLLTEAMRNG